MTAHQPPRHAHRALAGAARQLNPDPNDVTTVVKTVVKTAVVTPDATPTIAFPGFSLPFSIPNPFDPTPTTTKGKPAPTTSDTLDDDPTTVPFVPPALSTPTPSTTTPVNTVPTTVPVVAATGTLLSSKLTDLGLTTNLATRSLATSRTSTAQPSATSAAADGSKSGAGGIAGGVFGGLIGVGLLAACILWLVRRHRKKAVMEDAFNASNFRRSGHLLDDPAPPPKGDGFPPPPMMQAPSVPPASFPYGENAQYSQDPYADYSASAHHYNTSNYGADGQISRAHPYAGENNNFQYGGNLSGAAFGQHASYASPAPSPFIAPPMISQQFPQPPQIFGQTPAPLRPEHLQGSQSGRSDSPPPSVGLPNPFANPGPAPSARAQSPGPNAAFGALSTPTRSTHSIVPLAREVSQMLSRTSSAGPGNVAGVDAGAGAGGDASAYAVPASPPAYDQNAQYADVQREVAQVTVKAPPAAAATLRPVQSDIARPVSTHTLYDEGDAYGGM